VQLLPQPPEQVFEQVPVQLVQAPEQLPPHPELHDTEQSEHPLSSEDPTQLVVQLEAHWAVQSAQMFSLVQLASIAGSEPETARTPNTGKAFLAASLKNSLLLCKSSFCIFG
jgi:hypothetical protein